MTRLTDQQKQLLFDYSLGLTSDREAAEVEKLLSWNQEAVELYRTFQVALAPLDSVELESCPDDLTERLFLRLTEAARKGPDVKRLEELLAAERSGPRTIKIPLWRNWSEVVTAAAAVFLFVSVLFPSIGFMRQRYAQTHCGTHLAGVYEGFRNYMADHDGLAAGRGHDPRLAVVESGVPGTGELFQHPPALAARQERLCPAGPVPLSRATRVVRRQLRRLQSPEPQ